MGNVKSKYIMLFIITAAIVIIPVTVRVAILERTEIEVAKFGGPANVVDTFSYYKACLIIMFSVFISAVFLNNVMERVIKGRSFDLKGFFKKPLNAAMFVYIVAVILSTMFSPYKEIVFRGSNERHESVFILLGYCLFLYAVMYAVDTEGKAEFLIYGFFISALIIGGIGVMQFLGRDPFRTEAFQNFLLGKNKEYVSEYSVNFTTVFSTLYNPNCAGLYGSMMFIMAAALAVLLPVKSVMKYIAAVLTPVMLIVVVGSYSLSGVIGVIAGITAFIVIYAVFMISHKIKIKTEVIVAAAAILAAVAVFTQTPYFKSSWENLIRKADWSLLAPTDSKFYNYIRLSDDIVEVSTARGDFSIGFDTDSKYVLVWDAEKNLIEPLSSSYDEEAKKVSMLYEFASFKNLIIEYYGSVFILSYNGMFPFGVYGDGTLTALTQTGDAFDINEPVPSIGFENMQSFANSRGFIWSKSIPLILKNFLIGKGPDTFVMQFPQHDLVGKANFYHGDSFILIDKPHNAFIQYAVNTGLLSLIALIVVFAIYLISSFVLVAKSKPHHLLSPMQIGIFSGIFVYLVVSLSTDSTVSVSPVFWCLLGLGFAINNIKINENKEVKYVENKRNKRN